MISNCNEHKGSQPQPIWLVVHALVLYEQRGYLHIEFFCLFYLLPSVNWLDRGDYETLPKHCGHTSIVLIFIRIADIGIS